MTHWCVSWLVHVCHDSFICDTTLWHDSYARDITSFKSVLFLRTGLLHIQAHIEWKRPHGTFSIGKGVANLYTHTHTHTHIHTHIHVHTHTRTYTHTYRVEKAWRHLQHWQGCGEFVHTHLHTHIHIHAHTHTHTYTYRVENAWQHPQHRQGCSEFVHTHTYTQRHTYT